MQLGVRNVIVELLSSAFSSSLYDQKIIMDPDVGAYLTSILPRYFITRQTSTYANDVTRRSCGLLEVTTRQLLQIIEI